MRRGRLIFSDAICGGRFSLCPRCTYIQTLFHEVQFQRLFSSPAVQRTVRPVPFPAGGRERLPSAGGKVGNERRRDGASEGIGISRLFLSRQGSSRKYRFRHPWSGENPVRNWRLPPLSPRKGCTYARGSARSATPTRICAASNVEEWSCDLADNNSLSSTVEGRTHSGSSDTKASRIGTHDGTQHRYSQGEGRRHESIGEKEGNDDSCESGGRSPASSGSTGNDGHVSLSRSKGEKTALDLRAHVTPARECTDIKDGSTALDANRENEEAAVDPEHTRTLLQAKKSRMPEERISAVTWKPPEVASSDRSFQKGEFESSISVGCFHECEEKDRGKRLEDLNFPPFGHQSPFPHEYTSSTVSSSNTHPADVATRLVVAGVTAALSSVIYLLNMAGRETTRSGSIRSLPERSSKSRLHLSPLLQAVAKPLRHTVENALGQAVTLRTTTPASSWTPRTSSSPFESIYQVADTIAGLRGSMLHAAVCSLSLIPSMVSTAAVHASDREKNFPTMATYPGRANSWGGDDISRSEKRGKRASSSGRERSESPGDGLRLILEYFLIQLQQNTSPAALRAVEEKLTEFLMRPLEWHQFDPVSHEIRRQSQKRDEELKSRQPEARSSPLAFQASLYSVPPPTVWRKHGSPQEGPRAVSSSTLLEKRNDQNIPSARRGASPDLLTSSTQEVLHHANLSSAQRKCGGSSVVLDAERPVEKATTSQMEAQKILAGSHHELADVSSEALPSCSRVPLLSENTPEVQRHLLDRLYRQERRLEEHLKRVQDSERQLTASIQDLERLHVKLLNTTPAYASPHARFSPSALFRGSSDSSNERERLDKETYLERSDFRQISMANDTSKTSSTETSQTRGYVRSLEPDGSMSPAVMRPALPKEEGESLAKTQGSRSSRSQAGDASGPRQDLRVRSLPSTPLQRFLAFAFLLLQLSARAFFTAVKHFFRRLLRLLRKKGRGTPGPKEMGRHASVLSSSAIRTGIVDVVSKGTAVNVSHPNRTLPVAGPGTTSSGYADADAEGNERDVAWIEGHESQVTTAAPGNFTKRRSPSSNLIEHERSPELDISSPELEPDTPPSGTSEGGVAQTATSTQPRCTSKDRHNFRRGDADPTHPKHVQASETPYEHSNSLLLPVIHTSHAKAADSSEPRDAQYRVSTSGQKVGQVVAGTAAAAHGGNIPSRMPSSIPNDHFTESVAADSSTGKERDQQRRTPQGVSGVGVVDEILNDERIVKLLTDRMCRMRGAALKLMQMISMIEGSLPPALAEALKRTRDGADVMPESQLLVTLEGELGPDWRNRFASFEMVPFAAASIGQVHRATLPDGRNVAVKVQFPGVAESISSDLRNLKMLVQWTRLLPRSLFLDVLCDEMKTELLAECDYRNERRFYEHFRFLLERDFPSAFYVPRVYGEISTKKILVTDFVEGLPFEQVALRQDISQSTRDSISERLLKLVLAEIFVYRLLNTDANPSNFFYLAEKDSLALIDFGAGRTYEPAFIDKYLRLLHAAVHEREAVVKRLAAELGFFGGSSSPEFLQAQANVFLAFAQCFRPLNHQDDMRPKYSFRNSNVFGQLHAEMQKVMLNRERPPPPEIYSLHRKLAGCFLLCAKLGGRVDTPKIFAEVLEAYRAPDGGPFRPEPGQE